MQGLNGKARILGLAIAAGMFGAHSHAGELQPLEEIPTVSADLLQFCAPYGNFIACSSAVLNFVTNGGVDPVTGTIVNGGAQQVIGAFSINASQGFLSQDSVIVAYGDAAATKNPTGPGGTVIMDDAYSTPAGQTEDGFSTNTTVSPEELAVGVKPAEYQFAPVDNNPKPNSISNDDPGQPGQFLGDEVDYWDLKIDSLLTGLTTLEGVLRDPVFVFDNNQTGADQSIKLWGLLALRDLDGLDGAGNPLAGPLGPIVFEFGGCDKDTLGLNTVSSPAGCDGVPTPLDPSVLDPNQNSTVVDPETFVPRTALGEDPLVDEYALVQGQYCVNSIFNEVKCDGTSVGVVGGNTVAVNFNQNLGTNRAEFFGFLPGLTGLKLKGYFEQGYDVLSLDLRFFDQTNGFEDLFILAMGSGNTTIPEPGSLALLGMGAIGFAATRRRKQAAARG